MVHSSAGGRIGVILTGELDDIPALRMLILHMNTMQRAIVFAVLLAAILALLGLKSA